MGIIYFCHSWEYADRQGESVGKYCVYTVRAKNSLSSSFCGVNIYTVNPTPKRLDTGI